MSEPEPGAVSARWPEVIVALLLAALAVVVIADSLRVGIGWADDGPRSGYFPFYIGALMLGASVAVLASQLRRWHTAEGFVDRTQAKRVLAVLVPMVVYVAAMRWLGMYLASALLIGWFMRRHGRHRAALTAAVSVGVPLMVFLVFERWFLVPLPKGPIERLLGL